jgi:hypothetical protein
MLQWQIIQTFLPVGALFLPGIFNRESISYTGMYMVFVRIA